MSETKIAMKLEEESKPIKKMCEKLMDSVNHELDKGVENVDAKELGEVIDMIKDLYEAKKEMYEACYYKQIMEAMEEYDFEDEEEIMDEGRRGYRGQPRSQSGRFMSRGDGRRSNRGRSGRRGYDEMMYMPEYYRDMDMDEGRMYYTSANASQGSQGGSSMGSSSGGTSGDSMGYSEGGSMGSGSRQGQEMSRTESARRGYLETKEIRKGNSQEDKQAKQKELDKWMSEFTSDVKGMVGEMTPEEKTLLKTRLTQLQSSL